MSTPMPDPIPPISQTELLARLDQAQNGGTPELDWSTMDYDVLRYLVANTPPVVQPDAPAEFTAMTIVRQGTASHTVEDIEPTPGRGGVDEKGRGGTHISVGWNGCQLTILHGEPVIRLTDAYDVDPDGARQLAAELLSACARAEHPEQALTE